MDKRYEAVQEPPQNALKTIEFGKLKDKSDINPQWKIEALTGQYGLCGVGWKFEIAETEIRECKDGQVLLFMKVNLYVKDKDKWSEPIPGYGGDFIIEKNKNGLVPNDEAYKMCLTDALGNAMKYVGVAANVYRNLTHTKYDRKESPKENWKNRQYQLIDKFKGMAKQKKVDPEDMVMKLFFKRLSELNENALVELTERFDAAFKKYTSLLKDSEEEIPLGDKK